MTKLQRFSLLWIVLCFSLNSYASKESSEAYGGDNKGILWSRTEVQNIWRNPTQISHIPSVIQMSRTTTTFGGIEAGGYFNQKDIERILGYKFPVSFALYVNRSFHTPGPVAELLGFDFDSFDNYTGQRVMNVQTHNPGRFEYVFGGFFGEYDLAVRIGYEYLLPPADNASAFQESYDSAIDFSVGFKLGGFDLYGTYALEADTHEAANTERDNKTAYPYFEIGFRRELPRAFVFYGNYEQGSWDHRRLNSDATKNYVMQFGVAKPYQSPKGGEFFWDLRYTAFQNHSLQDFVNHFFPSSGVTVNHNELGGSQVKLTVGMKHQIFEWLKVASSLESPLYRDFDKPYDGQMSRGKMNLALTIKFGGMELDLASSFAGSSSSLSGIGSTTTGTLNYIF